MKNKPQSQYSDRCFVGVNILSDNKQLHTAQNIYIAYSGGIDSHVLLHLCATSENLKDRIKAVYVNHGLQAEAENWGKHCEQVCKNLSVIFISVNANAKAAPGESPEEAARKARYAALKPLLDKDDLLLVAQHAEDQLETVLLQLFRGSGLKGLSGMPKSMRFGKGKLLRPLLTCPKAAFFDYAQHHTLQWIEDPSNKQTDFDRNFLRNDIIPQLKQRWPSLDRTVSRSALHCANAQQVIDARADDLLGAIINAADNTLDIQLLQGYSLRDQQLILRQWFNRLGLKMPSHDFLHRILEQVIDAREDADPVLTTQGYCFRRYRHSLYCLKPCESKIEDVLVWPNHEHFLICSDHVSYEIVKSNSGLSRDQWQQATVTVKCRSGGETIQLPGRSGHHSLKNLFQEQGIPPWERDVMPLFYLDDKLAAVGDLWISAEFYCDKLNACVKINRHKIIPKGNDDTTVVD